MNRPLNIEEAFPLRAGTITAVVGGGGKSSLIRGLAESLAGRGRRVVTTTTTRAYVPSEGEAGRIVRTEAALAEALRESSPVALVPLPEGTRKGPGLCAEAVEGILDAGVADHILVEADGSRSRPFKRYRPGEPVVPGRTAAVIAVFGTDLIGAALGPENCLRSERLAEIGLRAGQTCGEEEAGVLFAALLGLLREMGPYPEIIPFLNKVEDPSREERARALAGIILEMEDPGVTRVILGSLREGRFREIAPAGR